MTHLATPQLPFEPLIAHGVRYGWGVSGSWTEYRLSSGKKKCPSTSKKLTKKEGILAFVKTRGSRGWGTLESILGCDPSWLRGSLDPPPQGRPSARQAGARLQHPAAGCAAQPVAETETIELSTVRFIVCSPPLI